MIKVYILPVERVNNTDIVAGIEFMHYPALLTYGIPENAATLVIDAPNEHLALSDLALEVRDPTLEEIAAFLSLEEIEPPTPDFLRACEILAESPPVITMVEIWELLRIIGRRLGYRFNE